MAETNRRGSSRVVACMAGKSEVPATDHFSPSEAVDYTRG